MDGGEEEEEEDDGRAAAAHTDDNPTCFVGANVQLLESNNGDPSAMDEDDVLMQQGGPVGPAEFEELGVCPIST